MTTYTLNGFSTYYEDGSETDVGVKSATTLELTVANNTTSFSYTVLPLEPGGTAPDDLFVDIALNEYNVRIDGAPFQGSEDEPDSQIFQVEWTGAGNVSRVSTVLILEETGTNVPPFGTVNSQHIFLLGGDALPTFNTLGDWNNFLNNSLDSLGIPPGSSPLGPNKDIALSILPGSSTQNDSIVGDAGDNNLNGGAGNDTIEGRNGNDTLIGANGNDSLLGGGGEDELIGGGGNDYLNPGNNTTGYDRVEPGRGNDTIDFANMTHPNAYAEIDLGSLSAGVNATLNSVNNTGTVNKGTNGSDTILQIRNPITSENGGFGFYTTTHDDSVSFRTGPQGFVQIGTRAGDDTITILGNGDTHVRIDSTWWEASSGVVADLGTGIISNDGHGGSDTIIGVDKISSFRGTMMNDNIQGGDGRDRIILMAGNDTADGGDGDRDLLRYDRREVEAVNVNLQTGVATGMWRGESFNHTISNFEEVRGSREGNDTIIGNNLVGEYIEGRGGNDSILGGGGNDTLVGNEGMDTLNGGNGNDRLEGGDDRDILLGGGGNDEIFGNAGVDRLVGGNGNDTLEGGAGNDNLLGGAGSDNLRGGAGNDSINPGTNDDGYDGVVAGAGQDTVDFSDVDETSSVGLEHWDLNAGVTITLNGQTNSASVNKGANGATRSSTLVIRLRGVSPSAEVSMTTFSISLRPMTKTRIWVWSEKAGTTRSTSLPETVLCGWIFAARTSQAVSTSISIPELSAKTVSAVGTRSMALLIWMKSARQ